jgi:Cys-rich repeat protein
VDANYAYCVDDRGSLKGCTADSDCPTGEFCDKSIGSVCDSGLSCASSYVPPGATKRDLFGAIVSSRVMRMNKRSVNKNGPNWKAYEDIVTDEE